MKQRCLNPKHRDYVRYGARGITIDPIWRDDFARFLADMGPRPPDTSIDRIDNNGNYEPSNCRWATACEQGGNKRNNRLITIGGETLCVSAWERRQRFRRGVIQDRIVREWDPERAVLTACAVKGGR